MNPRTIEPPHILLVRYPLAQVDGTLKGMQQIIKIYIYMVGCSQPYYTVMYTYIQMIFAAVILIHYLEIHPVGAQVLVLVLNVESQSRQYMKVCISQYVCFQMYIRWPDWGGGLIGEVA